MKSKIKNQPKEQHFFPEMFLQGFTNENRQIYMLDSQRNKITPRNIDSVAKQKHMYTVIKGDKKNYAVEERFSSVEGQAAELFRRIVNGGIEGLSDEDVLLLLDFIILTFVRTPITVKTAERVLRDNEIFSELQNVDVGEKERFIKTCLQSRGLLYALGLPSYFENRRTVITHNFDAFLLTAEEGASPFLLNDNFVCFEFISPAVYYQGKNVDWSKTQIKKHFPVSNKHCLSFAPKVDNGRKGTDKMIFYRSLASKEDVEVINRLSFRQKDRYVYCASEGAISQAAV